MRLKSRIDGTCDLCRGEFIDRAFSVVTTAHTLISQNGEPGIKEEKEIHKTVCPSCYGEVYRTLADR